jgi:hypothetical protein
MLNIIKLHQTEIIDKTANMSRAAKKLAASAGSGEHEEPA